MARLIAHGDRFLEEATDLEKDKEARRPLWFLLPVGLADLFVDQRLG